MSTAYIPTELRRLVSRTARYHCGYCLHPEELLGMPLTIDHIVPQAAGGLTTEENLWLACPSCNQFKGKQTHAIDPGTGKSSRIFNPRKQGWHEHFEWNEDSTRIIGKTPCGHATVLALQMNHPQAVVARRLWTSVGWWPPRD